jgi:hypothetical protein
MRVWTGFVWFRVWNSGKPFKYGNEHSGSIKGGKFPYQLRDYQTFKDFASWS